MLNIEDERRKRNTRGRYRLPCLFAGKGGVCKLRTCRSPGNLKFAKRAVAGSKKCRTASSLPKMRKGTTVMPESTAAYYSRWDEGIALKHFR